MSHAPDHKSRRRGRTRRGAGIWIMLIIVTLLLAVVGLSVRGMGKNIGAKAEVDQFIVEPRTFMVELREKGELKASKSIDVKSEVEGRSTIISVVDEGTAVKKGDLLVELASDQLDDRITAEELKEATAVTQFEAAKTDLDIQLDRNDSDILKAELGVSLKELELKKYTEGDWPQQRKDAGIAIEEAEIRLDRAREDFEAAKKLLERQFITKVEYDEDEFEFIKAQWDLEKAQTSQKVLLDYTHVADQKRLESELDEAKKELERVRKNAASEESRKRRNLEGKEKELEITRQRLAKLREQKDACLIRAPGPGFVVYYSGGGRFWSSDGSGQIKEGATVHERQVMMQLPDTTEMIVTVRIHEAKTNMIEIGQKAFVEVEGVPGRQFTGSVSKIAAVADTQNRWLNPDLKEYETEITLDRTDAPLKPGATAHVRIMVEEVRDELAIPIQAVYGKGNRRYVFKDAGNNVEPVEIELGSVGSEWAAVQQGLDKGDHILLAFDEELTRMIPALPEDEMGGPPGAEGQPRERGNRPGGRKGRRDRGAETVSQPAVTKPAKEG